MVSKNIIVLSLLMPIAMVIGTSIAIEFARYSSLTLLIYSTFAGLLGCVFLIIKLMQWHVLSHKHNNINSQPFIIK